LVGLLGRKVQYTKEELRILIPTPQALDSIISLTKHGIGPSSGTTKEAWITFGHEEAESYMVCDISRLSLLAAQWPTKAEQYDSC
jgi:hypothetical protein